MNQFSLVIENHFSHSTDKNRKSIHVKGLSELQQRQRKIFLMSTRGVQISRSKLIYLVYKIDPLRINYCNERKEQFSFERQFLNEYQRSEKPLKRKSDNCFCVKKFI